MEHMGIHLPCSNSNFIHLGIHLGSPTHLGITLWYLVVAFRLGHWKYLQPPLQPPCNPLATMVQHVASTVSTVSF